MTAALLTRPSDECPDQNTLAAFAEGRLSEPGMELVAGHLETCALCGSTFRDLLREPKDSFEAWLLSACGDDSSTITPNGAFDRMLAAARALCGDETASHDGRAPQTDFEVRGLGSIGPYTLLEVLGRGGMSIVYRAVHRVMRRTVALKMLLPGRHVRPEALDRFRTEAEAAARLDHPNVVAIKDFDDSPQGPYLVMELVTGETLARRLDRGPMEFREAAELVRTLAAAVEYAHGQKVVHRDLKPSNVLLASDGTLKVTDFGLAKILDDGRERQTRTGAILGTPAYMAPEQATGRSKDVDERTDVYALGAILYEALTGSAPHVSGNRLRFVRLLRGETVVPPSQHRPDVPAELEVICLKCLEPSSNDRYPTADAVAQNLERWLNGQWRRPSLFRRLCDRVRRVRRLAAGLALVAFGVGLVCLLFSYSWAPSGDRESAGAETKSTEIRTPDGKLLPFRIRSGDEKTRVTASADGTITVSSWGLCLVEYTPGPGEVPCRFRASVRHEGSDENGQVGLYFAHRATAGGFGETHQFGRLIYNDIRSTADSGKKQLPDKNLSKENRTRINFVVQVAGPEIPVLFGDDLKFGPSFVPCGRLGNCWRNLEVLLTPTGVRGTWEGERFEFLTAQHVTDGVADRLKHAGKRNLGPGATAAAARYDGTGGIGFVVERGSASFRKVEVVRVAGSD